MKVFVTGATGFVGTEIWGQLFCADHCVHLLARDVDSARQRSVVWASSARVAVDVSAEVHAGDVLDPKSLETAMSGADAVIHLVGIISEASQQTFENIHTRGTQNVIAAAQKAGIKRFIHMSALGTRRNAVSRYHKSKWAAEEAVRQSGLAYTIFRPSLIYGRHDQFVNRFAKIIRTSPVLPVLGNERAKFQPVAVECVGAAFVKSLTEPKSITQIYDLCGPEALPLPEILDQILEVMHRKRLKLRIPLPLARCQGAFLEFLFPLLLHKAPPLNRDQLMMLQEDNVGDAQPANELFGLQHRTFREGIEKYLGRAA